MKVKEYDKEVKSQDSDQSEHLIQLDRCVDMKTGKTIEPIQFLLHLMLKIVLEKQQSVEVQEMESLLIHIAQSFANHDDYKVSSLFSDDTDFVSADSDAEEARSKAGIFLGICEVFMEFSILGGDLLDDISARVDLFQAYHDFYCEMYAKCTRKPKKAKDKKADKKEKDDKEKSTPTKSFNPDTFLIPPSLNYAAGLLEAVSTSKQKSKNINLELLTEKGMDIDKVQQYVISVCQRTLDNVSSTSKSFFNVTV